METAKGTLLKTIEIIHEKCKKSKLNSKVFSTCSAEIEIIKSAFKITEQQSALVAVIIGLSCLESIKINKIMDYLGLNKIEFLNFSQDLIKLQKRNILEAHNINDFVNDDFFLKPQLIDFLINNKPIPLELISEEVKEFTFHEFLYEIDQLSDKKDNGVIVQHQFSYEFWEIIEKYKSFKLVDFANKNLALVDAFVFFDTIIDTIAIGNNSFNTSLQSTVDDCTFRRRVTFDYIQNFLSGNTKLNTLNLIEKDINSFSDRHKIRLTEKTLNMLSEWEGLKIGFQNKKNEKLIYPQAIKKTKLFYNPKEVVLLQPLQKSLGIKSFQKLQEKLEENNLSKGMTTLLYGTPGTGKTATVYQLAKKYNRAVFKVEISETKSMWFGESQKLVKKIFTDYYQFKKEEKNCPILLFNEADAIIGKRKSAGASNVSDTENAIQNILLEELENFDGILFATSNLVNNLDSAFERRFLFKIQFETPSLENAAKIWKSKLPMLSVKNAQILAKQYTFSGGEMDNIARKVIMEEVIIGNTISFETIKLFCNSEKWDTNTITSKIGF